jgi:catechol 2,3-dioxygenase-like lactoylglutathione lyase family enzyme
MVEYKLEVIVLPVADVDRAKDFYQRIGFREDLDYADGAGFRVVHFTPPGSQCSIIVGTGITTAQPGSVHNLHLIVDDIEEARADLISRGVEVSEIFHDEGGVFHHAGTEKRVPGLYPGRRSYGSFASFGDPDGNGFVLQEVTERAPGR